MIPRETVDRILYAADVVDVVSDFVSLKRRGANMIACCPFHGEKTPSFSVSPTKQIYKCFGCGKAGDSVRFIMDLEGLSYVEALRYLAKKYSIEIIEKEYTSEDLKAQTERENLILASEFAQKFFEKNLWESSEGQSIGYSYFRERGFSDATIKAFNLGYALDSKTALLTAAQKAGFSIDILEKAGLIVKKDDRDPIDRFRGRVVFPIHNVAGKPVAFGARILKSDPNAPKYLNSPESPIYHKSQIVYGIAHAKKTIKNADNCFLVEGYTDVVSLAQVGIENVVASSGTSLTKEQIQLIRRFSTNITVLYDGDTAGIKASLRGIDLILEEDLDVKAVVFPDGDDPDSYIKKVGASVFSQYVSENAKDFISFKTGLMLKDSGNDPIKKAGVISELVGSIAKIPNSIKRSLFTKQVADLLEIQEDILIAEGNKHRINQAKEKEKETRRERGISNEDFDLPIASDPSAFDTHQPVEKVDKTISGEEEICRILVLYGNMPLAENETGTTKFLAEFILEDLDTIGELQDPHHKLIIEHFKSEIAKGQNVDPRFFRHHTDEVLQQKVINWEALPDQVSNNWFERHEIYVPTESETIPDHLYRSLLRLRMLMFQKKIEHIQKQEITVDVLKEIMLLKSEINGMANELGTIVL